MKKNKTPIVILSIIVFLVVFRIGYGMWFARYIDSKFGKPLEKYDNYGYSNPDNFDGFIDRYCSDENRNSWTCFSPKIYSGKYGNLHLTYKTGSDKTIEQDGFLEGVLSVGFNLYTYFFGGTDDYSVRITYLDETENERYAWIELDRHMNLKDSNDLSNIELEVYEKYKPRINEIYEAAFEKWPELKK